MNYLFWKGTVILVSVVFLLDHSLRILCTKMDCAATRSPLLGSSMSRETLLHLEAKICSFGYYLALFGLHKHTPPLIHGDARIIANLIIRHDCDDLFWVDVMECQYDCSISFGSMCKYDVVTLIQSLFPSSSPIQNEELQFYACSYANDLSEKSTCDVAHQIFVRYRDTLLVELESVVLEARCVTLRIYSSLITSSSCCSCACPPCACEATIPYRRRCESNDHSTCVSMCTGVLQIEWCMQYIRIVMFYSLLKAILYIL